MTKQALLDAVYADPDDDAPREALAAHLIDAGDPRGELIQLQLAEVKGEGRPADTKKVKALLKKHAREWLEPLEGALVPRSVVWERGFPAAGELAMRNEKSHRARMTEGLPALATLRRLALGKSEVGFEKSWLEKVLFRSPMRGLHEITGLWQELLCDIARSKEPWSLTWVHTLSWNKIKPSDVADAFADGRGLPKLERLDLDLSSSQPQHYAWLRATDVGRRLRTLVVHGEWSNIMPWYEAITKWQSSIALERLVLGTLFSMTGRAFDWIALERTPAGWTRVTGVVGQPAVGPPGPKRDAIRAGGLQRLKDELAKLPKSVESTIEWL